jgi:hypothetical protein
MTSVIKVDTIQNSTGTDALSIDGSGNVNATGNVNSGGLTYRPAFLAGFTANPNGWNSPSQGSIIAFNSVSADKCFDVGSNFDTSTSEFVVPVSGVYQFGFNIYTLENNTISSFTFGINSYSNKFGASVGDGVASFVIQDSGAADQTISATAIMQLTANDRVGLYASGGSTTYYDGSSYLYGYLIA